MRKSFVAICLALIGFAGVAHAVSMAAATTPTAPARVSAPAATAPTPAATASTGTINAPTAVRGSQALANAYVQNQRNNYYMVTTPDVDTACRMRIEACLNNYCGDSTVIPGQRDSRCASASESELYNYALLCLQQDNTDLLPNFNVGYASGGMNTAARLCPSYVQQELMSYLSMQNMADQLTKQRSDTCVQRRTELEAAMSCQSVALSYGNETNNMLVTQLTSFCGAGVPGGSAAMVQAFANAGNVGANIWGWAEKIVSLDLSKKGADWESAVDAVVAGYVNRMNLACGDNMTLDTVAHPTDNGPTNLQIAATMAVGAAFPVVNNNNIENPIPENMYMEVQSLSNIPDMATARQVINAGLSNPATTQNAFLTSAQMQQMQQAYQMNNVKAFVISDNARCFIVPVQTMTAAETAVMAQTFASCRSN